MEVLHREIERLKNERRQLEFHVERTGTQNSTAYKLSHRNISLLKALPWTIKTKLITSKQQNLMGNSFLFKRRRFHSTQTTCTYQLPKKKYAVPAQGGIPGICGILTLTTLTTLGNLTER